MTKDKKTVTVASVYSQPGTLRTPAPSPPSESGSEIPALAAVFGVAVWCGGLLAGSLVFNVLDWRLGRLAVMCCAGAAVFVALMFVRPTSRLPRLVNAAIGLVAGAVFLAFAVSNLSPGYYGLRAEFHRIPDPVGWTSRNEQATGNSICFDVCKSIERELLPDTNDPESAERTMTRVLEARGYRLHSNDGDGYLVFHKGKFTVTYSYYDGQPVNSLDTARPPRWTIGIEARS